MMHITEQEVRELLPMSKAIELVEESFRRLGEGRAVNHPRRRIRLASGSTLHYMAAGDETSGYLGAKIYATNPEAGAHFLVVLFEPGGRLAATIEANALGQIRTGAAGGVAARYLARRDAAVVGMIGTGFQALAQLEALALVRTLELVKVYSRSPEKRRRFALDMSETLALPVEAVDSAEAAVRASAIVVTITSARHPVLAGAWLAPGCHVNAAGSNHARRRELDAAAVARASPIFVDSLEQARIESGDLLQAADEGRLDWSRVRELSEAVLDPALGRSSDGGITLFESQGLAIQDLLAAEYVYRTRRA
jgi:ornithine cyclodeaminase/alanine dehydrogenase-like protein (mu-crystallin family)